jgi:hypothetical protein
MLIIKGFTAGVLMLRRKWLYVTQSMLAPQPFYSDVEQSCMETQREYLNN